MNMQLGFCRVWLVLSVLFVIGTVVVVFHHVREEFARATFEAIFEFVSPAKTQTQDFEELLPMDCNRVLRGKADIDYSRDKKGHCWFTIKNFRMLYPEYNDLSDRDLSDRLYQMARIRLGPSVQASPAPWVLLLKTIAIAFGVPFSVLALGAAFGWAAAGFRRAAE